jgi:hypothetical protein
MRLDIIVAAERKTLSGLLEEMIDGRYRLALDAGLLEIGVKKEARYHDIFMVGHGDLWPPPGLIASKTLHIPIKRNRRRTSSPPPTDCRWPTPWGA